MPIPRDPLDILEYEVFLSELMEMVSQFSESYEEYAKNRRESSGSGEPRRLPAQSLGGEHPILLQIYNTREAINDFFKNGQLPINDQVQDTITTGRANSDLDNAPVVDPSGKELRRGIGKKFAERLWKEEDYWDTVFELEIASSLLNSGLNPKLVDEGTQTGPDVIVNYGDHDVWLECKRKRPKPEPEREQEWAINEIIDGVYDRVDFGEDSFALEIRGPRLLREDDIETISKAAANLARNQLQEVKKIQSEGSQFEIELVDYYEGKWETDLRPEWLETLQEYVDITNAVDTFGHLDYSIEPNQSYGHAEAQVKISEKGKLNVVNGYIVGVYCSEEIDYVDWIMEPIKRARRKLSGHEPSVILVDVPYSKIEEMEDLYTTNHKGEEVTQLQRLDERIVGQLADSGSISAIAVTSRVIEEFSRGLHQGRLVKSHINQDPGVELADEMKTFLNGNLG